jgi:hypothetical protein
VLPWAAAGILLAACAVAAWRPANGARLAPTAVAGSDPSGAVRDARINYLDARFARKLAIARDLGEGRASLWQAAARMRALDRAMPLLEGLGPTYLWLDHPVSEDERCCRDILRLARVTYENDPTCRVRLAGWECELEARLADGPLWLPE